MNLKVDTGVDSVPRPVEVFNAYLQRERFIRGGFVSAQWSPDGTHLWFLEGMPEDTRLIRVDLQTGQTVSGCDVAAVRAALREATGHEPPYRGLPFEQFSLTPEGRLAFRYGEVMWQLDTTTGQIQRRAGADSFSAAMGWTPDDQPVPRLWKRYEYMSAVLDVPEQLSPDGEWFASVNEHNIMLRAARARDHREQQLTSDGNSEQRWDIEGTRFKLSSGKRITFRGVNPWSPDSLFLFACRRDLRGVFQMPRVNWLKQFEDVEYLPYHKVGAKLDRVTPFFIEIRSGQQIPVNLGDTENRFVQFLAWHPRSRDAFLIVYTRDFKRVEIVVASRESGGVLPVLTEQSATFVKIQHDAIFSGEHGFKLLADGSGFLWLSTRDGWNHIYHYDVGGRLRGQLTQGDWAVHEIINVSNDGWIYFTASVDRARPYDVHVCRTALNGGGVEQLTREAGLHSPTFSPTGQAFLDVHSAVDRPTRTDIVRADGKQLRTLAQMDISALERVGYTPAEEFTVKAADGTTELWGVMYRPYNFDASRCYPVIEYIYGGPQTIEAARFFAADPLAMSTVKWPWALAQLGYIVVCLDARGTPGRSKSFHDAIYGNWKVGIADHAGAIRQLCQRHVWMDSQRVGVMGHSWGGYFSTCALMEAPDVYHAAVSYAPGYDVWDAVYHEPYMGQPQENRVAYDDANILKQVSKIKGQLMFLAGTSDYFVFPSAMKMTWALIEAGIEHEFVVIPQAYHQFVGAEEKYLTKKITGWFERHVMRRATTAVD